MDARLLQIREFQGEGFQPLIYSGGWRVAILHSEEDMRAEGIATMERHTETDEVFVLTRGKGVLLTGGTTPRWTAGLRCQWSRARSTTFAVMFGTRFF
jgi:hypothetical protein